MHIVCDKDGLELQKKAAIELALHLKEYNKLPVLLLISGGSSLGLLNFLDLKDITQNLTVSFLDERYTTKNENTNFYNFSNTRMYTYLQKNNNSVIDLTIKQNETLKDMTQQFEDFLYEWKETHKNGKIVITQGIGDDGHTAGIMPFPENEVEFEKLFEGDNWTSGYDAGEKNKFSKRITVTNTFLKNVVDVSVVYAKGENKKRVLKKVLGENVSPYILPATILHEMKEVHIFCDVL